MGSNSSSPWNQIKMVFLFFYFLISLLFFLFSFLLFSKNVSFFFFFSILFSIRFALVLKGAIRVSQTGWYTITTISDDGVRLYIGGVLVIDKWILQGPTPHEANVFLDSSIFYSIQIEYFQATGAATLKLR